MSKNYIIIPAHFDSKRLPGKTLLEETGKPLIQHTWERCLQVKYKYSMFAFDIYIATDSVDIETRCKEFGAKVLFTGPADHGTQRVAEAAKYLPYDEDEFNSVTNVQVDYPNFPIDVIPAMIQDMYKNQVPIATLAYHSDDRQSILDKDNVKVVFTGRRKCLYFSRSPIPYGSNEHFVHVGIYTFHAQVLQVSYNQLNQMKNPLIMESEGLEQNKWLFTNVPMNVVVLADKINSINTLEDYQRFVREYRTLIQSHDEF